MESHPDMPRSAEVDDVRHIAAYRLVGSARVLGAA
jgi:hypothetical protein